jgi:hypothetical protein
LHTLPFVLETPSQVWQCCTHPERCLALAQPVPNLFAALVVCHCLPDLYCRCV